MSAPTAYFDFDGTLIEGDSILYWIRHYYRRRPARRVFQIANSAGLVLYAARLISSHTLKRVFLWPMSFEAPAALDRLARDFVRTDLAFRFHPPVLQRLRAHDRLGHRVVVISASGSFYLNHLKELLPPACILLGTELEWKGGPLRFPRYLGGNLRGGNKIRRLRELGLAGGGRPAFAYSDHHHDIPLLEFAEFPECIRPTRRLGRLARGRGWPVRDWPGARPEWKRKLEALCLLLFAWAPRWLSAAPASADADEEAIRAHERDLRARLSTDPPAA